MEKKSKSSTETTIEQVPTEVLLELMENLGFSDRHRLAAIARRWASNAGTEVRIRTQKAVILTGVILAVQPAQ